MKTYLNDLLYAFQLETSQGVYINVTSLHLSLLQGDFIKKILESKEWSGEFGY
jgi:hypothetical protein